LLQKPANASDNIISGDMSNGDNGSDVTNGSNADNGSNVDNGSVIVYGIAGTWLRCEIVTGVIHNFRQFIIIFVFKSNENIIFCYYVDYI
jgi:hypothetical protein